MSVDTSYKEPLKKFVNRITEGVEGKAPCTTAICRYNQRVVPVLSYVSQLASPPTRTNIAGLGQWAVHRILRLPANSLSRDLCHSVSVCSAVDPIPLKAYCAANLFRFARSEQKQTPRVGLYSEKASWKKCCSGRLLPFLVEVGAPPRWWAWRTTYLARPFGCNSLGRVFLLD